MVTSALELSSALGLVMDRGVLVIALEKSSDVLFDPPNLAKTKISRIFTERVAMLDWKSTP